MRPLLTALSFALLSVGGFISHSLSFGSEVEEATEEIYIPKDLDDCFLELKRVLPPELIEKMRSKKESQMIRYHHGLGTWLRNNWGLWGDSRLSSWFMARGIDHADDMSGIILDSFWRHLNDKPIELDQQIKYYRDYWEQLRFERRDEPSWLADERLWKYTSGEEFVEAKYVRCESGVVKLKSKDGSRHEILLDQLGATDKHYVLLQGKWRTNCIEKDGKPLDTNKHIELHIEGDCIDFFSLKATDARPVTRSFRAVGFYLELTEAPPHHLLMHEFSSEGDDKLYQCAYSLKGNCLLICISNDSTIPRELATRPGDNCLLYSFQRLD